MRALYFGFTMIMALGLKLSAQPFDGFASFDGKTDVQINYISDMRTAITVETWFKMCKDEPNVVAPLFSIGGLSLMVSTKNLFVSFGNSTQLQTRTGLTDGNWHHISVSVQRKSSSSSDCTWWVTVDGKKGGTKNSDKGNYVFSGFSSGSDLGIFHSSFHPSGTFQMDEFRVSNTIRYPTSFSLQKAPLWNDEFTRCLIHFDDAPGSDSLVVESNDSRAPKSRFPIAYCPNGLTLRTVKQGIHKLGTLPTTICYGDSFQIEATGGQRAQWEPKNYFTNGVSLTTWVRPTQSGYLTVQVFDTAACEASKDSVYINVRKQKVNLEIPTDTICLGESAKFAMTKPKGVGNFYWSSSSPISNPNSWNQVFKPTNSTTYYLNIEDGSCHQVIPYRLVVGSRSELELPLEEKTCLGDTLKLKLSDASNIQWNSNLAVINKGTDSASFKLSKPLSLSVTYTNRLGCKITDSFSRAPREVVFANAAYLEACSGGRVELKGTTRNIKTMKWFSDTDPFIANQCCPTETINKSQWFYLEGTDRDGCYDLDSVFVKMIEKKDITLSFDRNKIKKCQEDTIKIAITNSHPYEWRRVYPLTVIDDTIYYHGGYDKTITAVAIVPGCSLSESADISIQKWDGPSPSLTKDYGSVCRGDTMKIQATQVDSFRWKKNSRIISKKDTNTIWVTTDTTSYSYRIHLVAWDKNDCPLTISTYVNISQFPDITIGALPPVCLGDSIKMDIKAASNQINIDNIKWLPPVVTKHKNTYYAQPTASTKLAAIWPSTTVKGKCFDTTFLTVDVSSTLQAQTIKDTTVVSGNEIILAPFNAANGGIPPYQYQWARTPVSTSSLEQARFSEMSQPSILIQDSTQFLLTVTDAAQCARTDTLVVQVEDACEGSLVFDRSPSPIFYQGKRNLVDAVSQVLLLPNDEYLSIAGYSGIKVANSKSSHVPFWNIKFTSIALAPSGMIYAATPNIIYEISPTTFDSTSFAGKPNQFVIKDGIRSLATFKDITAIRVAASGDVYVLDFGKLRRIRPNGQVSTITYPSSIPSFRFSDFDISTDHKVYLVSKTTNLGYGFYEMDSSLNVGQLYYYDVPSKVSEDGVGNAARMQQVERFRVINDSLLWFFDAGRLHLRQLNLRTKSFTTVLDRENNVGLIDYFGQSGISATNLQACLAKSKEGQFKLALKDKTFDIEWAPVICRGETVELSVIQAATGTNYLWNDNSTKPSIKVNPLKTTHYSVDLSTTGCKNTLRGFVYVDHADAGLSNTICDNDVLILGDSHNAGIYQWLPASVNNGINFSPKISVSDTTHKDLVLMKNTSFCGLTVDSIGLKIHEPQGELLKHFFQVCDGDSVFINAQNAMTYTWIGKDINQQGKDSFITYKPIINDLLEVIMDDGVCTTRDTVEFDVKKTLPLTIAQVGSSNICRGDTIEFKSNETGTWSSTVLQIVDSNSTTAKVVVDQPGTIWINKNKGCFKPAQIALAPDTAQIEITNLGDSLDFCENDSLLLNASLDFSQMLWSDSLTSTSRYVNTTGAYTVSGYSTAGCKSTSASKWVQKRALPDSILTYANDTLKAAEGTKYTWYKNGTLIAGAEQRNYRPATNGNYQVHVENAFGCTQKSSFLLVFVSTPAPLLHTALTVFPNPAHESFVIETSGLEQGQLQVFNMVGTLVHSSEWAMGTTHQSLDCSAWPAGSYLVSFVGSKQPTKPVKITIR